MKMVDMVIIGGGPAGLSAAIRAYELGIRDILVIERNDFLGGILNQCIHNGFGLHIFGEELTGPEYAARLAEKVEELGIPYLLGAMVMDIRGERRVTVLSQNGMEEIMAKTVILAMGCRERPRGAVNIPGDRPSGIFLAGTAQELVNLHGYRIGHEAVILGSGDIGLIMARRLTYEGVKVKCVLEIMPYSGGLKRNIVQCLEDYQIPLRLRSTVIHIVGRKRLKGVMIAGVDDNRQPIPGTEEFISCDTLLLSVGLIPENELTKNAGAAISKVTGGALVDNGMQTSVPGIFACGNVLHIHDLADHVTLEAYEAAENAVKYLNGQTREKSAPVIPTTAGEGIRYVVPQLIDVAKLTDKLDLKLRTNEVRQFAHIVVRMTDGNEIKRQKKRIVTPGEMETLTLKGAELDMIRTAKTVTVSVEGDADGGAKEVVEGGMDGK